MNLTELFKYKYSKTKIGSIRQTPYGKLHPEGHWHLVKDSDDCFHWEEGKK